MIKPNEVSYILSFFNDFNIQPVDGGYFKSFYFVFSTFIILVTIAIDTAIKIAKERMGKKRCWK